MSPDRATAPGVRGVQQKNATADEPHESVGAELAGIAGEAGIGTSELVDDHPSTARAASGGH
ncbi:hypothetical protein ACNJ7E_28060 [Rhodococcus sp. NM-2]|uniref:hypothetical protein n=1 Tax=Rhodococcus sp. NM-2 TaxID=3401174 RepID=UPI003AAF1C5E